MSFPMDVTVYTKTKTATADTPFQVDDDLDVFLTAINIHAYTNDAYYGNRAIQQGIIRVNAVVWFDGIIRVSDLWFKNLTAGSNAQITITGILANRGR
jgi:hypothetical protein